MVFSHSVQEKFDKTDNEAFRMGHQGKTFWTQPGLAMWASNTRTWENFGPDFDCLSHNFIVICRQYFLVLDVVWFVYNLLCAEKSSLKYAEIASKKYQAARLNKSQLGGVHKTNRIQWKMVLVININQCQ